MSEKVQAKTFLTESGIKVGQDFDSLSPAQISVITAEAAAIHLRKYGKPMGEDNASLVRSRYDLLQRRAR